MAAVGAVDGAVVSAGALVSASGGAVASGEASDGAAHTLQGVGGSFQPEMALFRNFRVNRRDCLCDVLQYASAQSLD